MSDIKNQYENCTLCPRNCGVNRNETIGYCREKSVLHVARAALHMWEEPCISGISGSGTVFFSGCNMGCVFCQNKAISRGETGKYIDEARLADIFFELEDKGANNINLVTGDIFIPTIISAIEEAKKRGIKIPFLLNTSSYTNIETLKALEGLIDIYLPDFKYIREEDAIKYSNAPHYPNVAKAAIEEMIRQQPECIFGDEPQGVEHLLKKGVIVRHLLMPDMLIQAKLIVRYLHEKYKDQIYLSLMNQFTPNESLSKSHPEISRKVTEAEYNSLVDYAANLGITKAYIQEGDTAEESFIPQFDCTGV
ncbi:MAG: radical SAM protein [Lachnospiraceae bacterium]|nr:radical SAM protein [Lachnospiraceae bacterium]